MPLTVYFTVKKKEENNIIDLWTCYVVDIIETAII